MLFVLLCGSTVSVSADDGYRLWLRYEQLPSQSLDVYRQQIKSIAVQGQSATFDAIRRELSSGCAGLLGTPIVVGDRDDASVVVGLPQTSPLIRRLRWEAELKKLGPEGLSHSHRQRRESQCNRYCFINRHSERSTAHFTSCVYCKPNNHIDRLQIDQKPASETAHS